MPRPESIVVTGIGAVTPIGSGSEFWPGLVNGRSGAAPLARFSADGYPSKISSEITDFNATDYMPPDLARRLYRAPQLAYAAATLAVEHAKLDVGAIDSARSGVVVGTGVGGMPLIEQAFPKFVEHGPRGLDPSLVAMMMPNAVSAAIAIGMGLRGPNEVISTACASGGHAIARSIDFLRGGRADVILAGGTEAAVTPMCFAAFCAARVLSHRNDEPQAASRPFDRGRDGFVLGEAGAVMVLETRRHAEARGAQIVAEVLGYGVSCDAFHLAAPHAEGEGAARCMRDALADADLSPRDVGHVNAHATSTRLGDVAEVAAIRSVFGTSDPCVTAVKSMTGHLLGASGTVEAAAAALSVNTGTIPPTINLDDPDPACAVDIVANTARHTPLDAAVSTSFGFGGHNVALVFGKA